MGWIESVPVDECLALLRTMAVGRLAVIEDGKPLIFPVNYGLDGEAIIIRTDTGTKLWAATRAPVAFEIDDVTGTVPWSVVVTGVAYEITPDDEPAVAERIMALSIESWAPGDKPYYVRIVPTEVSGRRIRREAPAPR